MANYTTLWDTEGPTWKVVLDVLQSASQDLASRLRATVARDRGDAPTLQLQWFTADGIGRSITMTIFTSSTGSYSTIPGPDAAALDLAPQTLIHFSPQTGPVYEIDIPSQDIDAAVSPARKQYLIVVDGSAWMDDMADGIRRWRTEGFGVYTALVALSDKNNHTGPYIRIQQLLTGIPLQGGRKPEILPRMLDDYANIVGSWGRDSLFREAALSPLPDSVSAEALNRIIAKRAH